MLNQIIKTSPHNSFKVTQLCESVAICEAVNGDRHGWNNSTETEPAFIVYDSCKKEEVEGYVKTFNTFYRCYWCEVRKPKYLTEFEAEIKIRGMQRYSDIHQNSFGLDYLVQSELNKQNPNHFGIVQNGIHPLPAYTRLKIVTWETHDGNQVQFQLDADYPMDKLIQTLVAKGDTDHLSYVKTEYFWQRNWNEYIDGEF